MPQTSAVFLISCHCVLFIFAAVITKTNAQWWFLGSTSAMRATVADTSIPCSEIPSLSHSQRALCQKYRDHILLVSEGAQKGIEECQYQFRARRWNCSTTTNKKRKIDNNDSSTVFGKVIDIGSRETAFTYAISAAGVVHAIARGCKEGRLEACGCSNSPRPDGLRDEWEWGGCGDNLDYAYGFAHEFIDARERDNVSPRNLKSRSRKVMNLHNNEAGRMTVVRGARPTCKCNGVSGSCSLNTCWLRVPHFREIGDKIREKHDSSIEIKVNKRSRMRPRKKSIESPTITDLVHLDSSPDYCRANSRTGVLGTKGRECNAHSDGSDGCGLMCCGRGYDTRVVDVEERCNCRFQWCCVVRCQKCIKRVQRYICR
uniref:Protein Wnt n=1 Tax=Halocynthia roretzi TaxID=7729 RepID=Q8T8A8_HALRO|nr:ascidian homolog of wnt-5 [Halocynthia roretzi]